MKLEGVTETCARLWERGAVALVGISPFNSYFSAERISAILEFCGRDQRRLALFIPDDVTRFTLQARGYAPEQADKKARRQVQYLRNKIARAAGGREFPVFGCAELETNPEYVKRRDALRQTFETDRAFREGCLETTRWVLAASEDEQVGPEAVLLGVRYLLAELPMFLHAPEILGEANVVFIYHQCPDFVAALYRGGCEDMHVAPGQGFGVLRFSDREETELHEATRSSFAA